MIKYFVRIGEILNDSHESNDTEGDKLVNICEKLGMNEEQLDRLQKSNGTKTARSIIRSLYPPDTRMNISHDDIEPDIRHAIHGTLTTSCFILYFCFSSVSDYVQIYHGIEGLREGRVNESINNVFRSAKKQYKEKTAK